MSISPGVLSKPCDGNQLIPGALNALKTGTLILYLFKTPPKPCPDSRRKAKKLVQTTGFTPNSICSTFLNFFSLSIPRRADPNWATLFMVFKGWRKIY